MFAQVVLEKGHICGNAEPQGKMGKNKIFINQYKS